MSDSGVAAGWERRWAWSIAALATVAPLAAAGHRPAAASGAVLAALVGATIVADLVSAYVLLAEFTASRERWLPVAAGAYALTGALAIPYLLTFPEVFSAGGLLGARPETALEIWLLWHAAFPAAVAATFPLGFLRAGEVAPRGRVLRALVAVPLVAVAAALAATPLALFAGAHLPPLVVGHRFTSAVTGFALPVLLLLDLAALAAVVAAPDRPPLATRLIAALVGSALDAALGLLYPRFSVGWYVGKGCMVASALVLVGAFVTETSRLRLRLAFALQAVRSGRERERVLARERLTRMTTVDAPTGLPNRVAFEERLRERAGASAAPFAVLVAGLHGIRGVVELYGRAAGDEALGAAAARLREDARAGDLVARVGADELAVLAETVAGETEADAIGRRLAASLGAPIIVGDALVGLEVAVGAALAADADDAGALLDRAEIAAERARATRAPVAVYRRAFAEDARRHRRLQDEMASALLKDEFVLHYQPIVDLRTGAPQKAEALIRWRHPERGLLPPGAFIPAAERSGPLIGLLGTWVAEAAIAQAAAWRRAGAPLRVAINVSAFQLDDEGFFPRLVELLDGAALPPELLELEVTESAAMSDPARAQEVLSRCRALGIRIALDDFGTYYSSLTYLKRLPIDTVKVDRSFVSGLPASESDAAIVTGIIGLARALGRDLVAEGIETEAQRAWLIARGCALGQGYLFSRPVPAEAMGLASGAA